jgi:chemotaxis protein MotB
MAQEEPIKKQEGGGAPRWMCTFADLMSLLLCFFVLMLSFSSMDNLKFKRVAGSIKDAFGLQKHSRMHESPRGQQRRLSRDFQKVPLDVQVMLQEAIQKELDTGIVEIEHSPEGLTLRIKGKAAFDFGSAVIRPQLRQILDELASVVASTDMHFEVGGHTDNVPVREGGPFSSNYDLSARRAVAVVEYWRSKKNIEPEKLSAVGYADGVPVVGNDTEASRERNRRVEFKVRPLKEYFAFYGIKDIIAP